MCTLTSDTDGHFKLIAFSIKHLTDKRRLFSICYYKLDKRGGIYN